MLKLNGWIILVILGVAIVGCAPLFPTGNQSSEGATYIAPEDIKVIEEVGNASETYIAPDDIKVIEEVGNASETDLGIIEETIEEPKEESPKEEKAEAPATAPSEEEKTEAVVIIVQETEKVSLEPQGQDPDKDAVTFTYSKPLDDRGGWQTAYGDAGEYTVTVTVSDGKLTTSQDVLIIVNKKEEAPSIDNALPSETMLKVDENSALEFKVEASDLNKDPLTYSWKLDEQEISTGPAFNYGIGYTDAGSHTVKADVSDGTLTTSKSWSVEVNNVNRLPIIEALEDINVKETESVEINVAARDPDDNTLSYSISDATRFKQDGNRFTWATTYDDSGDYEVTVSVNDGTNTASQKVKIHVENVNRPPVITGIVQKK